MNITTKADVGQEVFYISHNGKIMSNKVELVNVTIGKSTYAREGGVGVVKSGVETLITYRLANTPASYLLTESSIFISKEELLSNAE